MTEAELELKNALMQIPTATDSVTNRLVKTLPTVRRTSAGAFAALVVDGDDVSSGGGGGGGGVDSSLTVVQLAAAELASTLTAGTLYRASDDATRLYYATTSAILRTITADTVSVFVPGATRNTVEI